MNTFQRHLLSPLSALAVVCLVVICSSGLSAHAQNKPGSSDSDKPEAINNSNLNGETAMLIMLGEMKVSEGDLGAGYSLMLDAAKKSGDESVYKRAVEIALSARNGTTALEGARIWKKAFPMSRQANQHVLQIRERHESGAGRPREIVHRSSSVQARRPCMAWMERR